MSGGTGRVRPGVRATFHSARTTGPHYPTSKEGQTQSDSPTPWGVRRAMPVPDLSTVFAVPVVIGLCAVAALVLFLAGSLWPGVAVLAVALVLVVRTTWRLRSRTQKPGRHRR